jgi:hypothetical protein
MTMVVARTFFYACSYQKIFRLLNGLPYNPRFIRNAFPSELNALPDEFLFFLDSLVSLEFDDGLYFYQDTLHELRYPSGRMIGSNPENETVGPFLECNGRGRLSTLLEVTNIRKIIQKSPSDGLGVSTTRCGAMPSSSWA